MVVESKKYVNKFKKNGFVHFQEFFNKDLCNQTRREVINFLDNFRNDNSILSNSDFEFINNKKRIKYCQSVFEANLSVRKFLTSELANTAAELLEVKSVYLAGVEIHIRNSGGGIIPIHQDNVSFCLKNAKALTAYIVLDEQDENTGGLGYLPTESGGFMFDHSLTNIPAFSAEVNFREEKEKKFIFPSFKIGDVSFHHCQTPHRAFPRPTGLENSYALSPRFFAVDDQMDEKRFKIYKENLLKHRKK